MAFSGSDLYADYTATVIGLTAGEGDVVPDVVCSGIRSSGADAATHPGSRCRTTSRQRDDLP